MHLYSPHSDSADPICQYPSDPVYNLSVAKPCRERANLITITDLIASEEARACSLHWHATLVMLRWQQTTVVQMCRRPGPAGHAMSMNADVDAQSRDASVFGSFQASADVTRIEASARAIVVDVRRTTGSEQEYLVFRGTSAEGVSVLHEETCNIPHGQTLHRLVYERVGNAS